MSGQPTEIYSAASTQQAYLLKGLLEEQGIAAWVVNDAIQIAGGELPVGWRAAAKVVVGAADALEARRIAEEFDQRTSHEASPDEVMKQAAATTEWADWPRCPECGERREARCTVCGLPGSKFPLADIDDTGPQPRVLLICQACDDHFLPEWYRLCHRCGYDYGEGIVIDTPDDPEEAADNRRLWVVGILLALIVAALLAYFAWLTLDGRPRPEATSDWRAYSTSVSVTRRTSITDLPGISTARSVSGPAPFSSRTVPSFSGRNSFIWLSAGGRGSVSWFV